MYDVRAKTIDESTQTDDGDRIGKGWLMISPVPADERLVGGPKLTQPVHLNAIQLYVGKPRLPDRRNRDVVTATRELCSEEPGCELSAADGRGVVIGGDQDSHVDLSRAPNVEGGSVAVTGCSCELGFAS